MLQYSFAKCLFLQSTLNNVKIADKPQKINQSIHDQYRAYSKYKKWEDRNQDRNKNINHSVTTLCADCHDKNGSSSATLCISQNKATILYVV